MGAVESTRGQLLVAGPALIDPNFLRTVVLVVEHTDEGAMGLVLNRVHEATVADAVPDLVAIAGIDAQLHLGGPVQPNAVMVLAEFDDPVDAAVTVFGDVGLPHADSDLHLVGERTRRGRVFAGHAGWGPGQLDAELERDDWLLADPEPDDVFSDDPEALWSTVLQRKGGHYALLARMPVDPSVN